MGFYFELNPVAESPHTYVQAKPPSVFWILYGILGFALACMGGAAFGVLSNLASSGSEWDQAFLYGFAAMYPIYLLLGLYLLGMRKFIAMEGDTLKVGHSFFGKRLYSRSLKREDIASVDLVNQIPSQNMAINQHDDSQYYFQGHWRILARLKNGKNRHLDRHNDHAALDPLLLDLKRWLG